MGRFIEGCDRREQVFLPACIDDYVAGENPVRVVDLFVDELDMASLSFAGAASTGRPGYHPATMLKLYIYGYLNQVQSSRRLGGSLSRGSRRDRRRAGDLQHADDEVGPLAVDQRDVAVVAVGAILGPARPEAAVASRRADYADEAGIHRTYVSDIERGARNPTIAVVEKLAAPIGVSTGSLLD